MQPLEGVIAGSAATASYMQSHDLLCQWTPGDIDIFFLSKDSFLSAKAFYERDMQGPLFLHVYYDDWVPTTLSLCPSSNFLFKDLGEDLTNGVLQRVANHFNLCDSIDRWCGDVATDMKQDDMPGELVQCLDVLRDTTKHLPTTFRTPAYKILASIKIRPYEAMTQILPATLSNINLILVHIPMYDDASMMALQRHEYTSVLCSNFDITLCAVALNVDECLVYQYETFLDASADIRENKLSLTSCAFSSERNRVNYQMSRIWKYVLRGFRW